MAEALTGRSTEAAPAAQADWVQYRPWQVGKSEAPEPKRVNTITIFCLAKKMMVEEWRRARGLPRRDPRLARLEGTAKECKARKIEREQEEGRQAVEFKKERQKILDGLARFVDSMLEKEGQKCLASLEDVGDLVAAAFDELGVVIGVDWAEGGGYTIWLEPRAERRKRRTWDGAVPALRCLRLDARLNIAAYERVTDPIVWQEIQKDLLRQPFCFSESEIGKLQTQEVAGALLEERAAEVGRVLEITSENGSWKIRLQPWDEVRARKLSKSTKSPIPAYEIAVSKGFETVSCNRLED